MPQDRDDLVAFLRALPAGTPILWVGLGSNLLVRDGGIRGVVIQTQDALSQLERRGEREVYAEAGVPCARLARQCAKWNLGPAEFFTGIPGTLGGALAMNAGAFGGETWRQVTRVETIDAAGGIRTRDASEYRSSYRHIEQPAPQEWFLAATLRFEGESSAEATRELLEKRRQTQPIGEWSCGSVFTNPPAITRAADRGDRPQGFPDRRRRRLDQARQFHPQRRRGERPRHRVADRTRAARSRARAGRHAPARMPHRRRGRIDESHT